MIVQRVLVPDARRESWTVLGDDGPVAPIERYLGYRPVSLVSSRFQLSPVRGGRE
jgi:hypothetical protein